MNLVSILTALGLKYLYMHKKLVKPLKMMLFEASYGTP